MSMTYPNAKEQIGRSVPAGALHLGPAGNLPHYFRTHRRVRSLDSGGTMFVLRAGRLAGAAALVLLSTFSVEAQPALTTIHDVLYKADGTKFNGYAVINWNSFEAGDTSNIATQFRSVKIVDGNFTVKLVPTTN